MNPSSRRKAALGLALVLLAVHAGAEPLASTTWGFRIDPPEGYAYTGGDGRNRFSFILEHGAGSGGAVLDLAVYEAGRYASAEALAADVAARISSKGDREPFEYRGKQAVLMRLELDGPSGPLAGWGLCVELGAEEGKKAPLLVALAYGPADREELEIFHLSALDSLAPSAGERNTPGPLADFAYPPGERRGVLLPGLGVTAVLNESDAEAAQAVVAREFAVLREYTDSPLWKEAWIRFYRALYRDAYDRLADVAFAVDRAIAGKAAAGAVGPAENGRALAEGALAWVQGFAYERDLLGTDFVDLVTAAVEGRGDCDSRALLWAIILRHGNVPSAIMVSRDYSHAMGLAGLEGTGARFDLGDKKWLVAETTAVVPLGLIGSNTADPAKWLGILLE